MLKIEATATDPAGNELVRVNDVWMTREEFEAKQRGYADRIKYQRDVIFAVRTLIGFAICAAALAYAVVAHAREYRPDTREALLIRPERPATRINPSVPCLTPPEAPKRVTWVVRDAKGNILIIGSQIILERC